MRTDSPARSVYHAGAGEPDETWHRWAAEVRLGLGKRRCRGQCSGSRRTSRTPQPLTSQRRSIPIVRPTVGGETRRVYRGYSPLSRATPRSHECVVAGPHLSATWPAASIGRRGDAYHNAPAEKVISPIKTNSSTAAASHLCQSPPRPLRLHRGLLKPVLVPQLRWPRSATTTRSDRPKPPLPLPNPRVSTGVARAQPP